MSSTTKSSAPVIGVFDSGVGGLTVLKELVRLNPADYLYFGDTARLPYGSKSAATVAKYALSAAKFLESEGARMLVIACNTATALAFDEIKRGVAIPVVGVVEPGAERAASASKTKRVAVIATEATIASHAYRHALKQRGIAAVEKPCPLFVPLVEEGWIDHEVTRQVAQIYLQGLFGDGNGAADVLLLGCTHYPLLRPLLEKHLPNGVAIVDSAESTAQAVAAEFPGDSAAAHSPKLKFFATDSVEKFRKLGERFMGHALDGVQHVDIEV